MIKKTTTCLLVLVLPAVLLGGCGKATTVKRNPTGTLTTPQRPSTPKPGVTVQVRPGDTVYSIGRSNNIHGADLIAWNNLASPDHILPGQTLRLYPSASAPAAVSTSGNRPTGTAPQTTIPAAPTAVNSGITWRWPADGQVITTFSATDKTRQGIDIAGTSGAPVRATADGVVVYSGDGLVGFGELIIVKHSDQWLSAYGHNRKRLVNEGQNVTAGQQIAELGRTGTNTDKLHFEIRYNGKPQNPTLYLPNR